MDIVTRQFEVHLRKVQCVFDQFKCHKMLIHTISHLTGFWSMIHELCGN